MLRLLCAVFAAIGAFALFAPQVFLSAMELTPSTPSALAEMRAAYSGTFAGLAALCIAGLGHKDYQRLALGICAIVLGSFTLARAFSLALDGMPNTLAWVNHGLEALGFIITWWLWRGSPPPTKVET